MGIKSCFKRILQILPGLLVLLGLVNPSLALAQTVPPLPFPRHQLSQLNYLPGAGPALQPNAVQTAAFPASRLAFQSYRDNNWEIYAGNDDGSNLARLTNNKAIDMQPRINRGATRIAFASKRDGNYEIYTMNMDGSGLIRLTKNTTDDVGPAWSPDGTKIAFQSYRDGNAEVYLMNADGTQPTRLTNNAGFDGQPTWSPDGTKIAYISGATYNLFVMNADGSDSHVLSTDINSADPTWSPDGIQIGYDADYNKDGYQELMIYDTALATARLIKTPSPRSDTWAGSWSPDGRYLAYTYISYVYYQGAWYWTYANLETWDSQNNEDAFINLAPGNTEWNPDWQSTDPVTPTSSMSPLPTYSPMHAGVFWSGTDAGGSGLKDFDVQVKDGADGSWKPAYTETTMNFMDLGGLSGHTYYFRVRARSNALNVEPWRPGYDAMTTVDPFPPTVTIEPLPKYSENSVTVHWSGDDQGGSKIASFTLQYENTKDNYWNTEPAWPDQTWETFSGIAGRTYCFRISATDTSNNVSPFTAVTDDTCSTIYSYSLSGAVHDATGAPVETAQVTLNPLAINTPASDAAGIFNAYWDHLPSSYTVNWAKGGYGSPPLTTISSLKDAGIDITLPPADNIIRGGEFEAGSLVPQDWQTGGTLPVILTTTYFHTGKSSVHLAEAAGKNGDASVSQTLTIPGSLSHPTLAFYYQVRNTSAVDGAGLNVSLQTDAGEVSLLSIQTDAKSWTFQTLDLSQWSGQTVTLKFSVHQAASGPATGALIDDVALGSTYPDLWVTSTGVSGHPGDTVTFDIACGNRGGAPAANAGLTFTLPVGLTFVSADLAPTSQSGATLTWSLGDLAPKSQGCAIHLTAQIAATVKVPGALAAAAAVTTSSTELEVENNTIHPAVDVLSYFAYLPNVNK